MTVDVNYQPAPGQADGALTLQEILRGVQGTTRQLDMLIEQGKTMANEIARLTSEVEETKTVVGSTVVLLGKLSDLIRDNVGNPAALTKLADDLDAQQEALSAAVAANTPAAEG